MTSPRQFQKIILRTLSILTCTAITGCATGPAFQKVENVPADKGLVYIYRPSVMHGAALVPYVVVNDFRALPLKSGGYYTYVAPPGPVTVVINHVGRQTVSFDVEAGHTYYVKGGTIFMAMGIPYIEMASSETALPELAECKQMPDTVGP
jgi:hypothetical protein